MEGQEPLVKLFGSRSRVALLQFFYANSYKAFRVNEIRRQTGVNARLVSSELKKLNTIGLLSSKRLGNSLLYELDRNSPFVEPLKGIFTKQDWLEWERPSRIHHLVLTLVGGLRPMKEYYGHCLPYAHLVFNYDNVTWFFKLNEFVSLGKRLIPIYRRRRKEIWRDFELAAAALWNHADYKSFYNSYLEFWKIAFITEPISFYIDSLLKPEEHISIEGKSFTDEYEEEIWKLAKQSEKIGLNRVDVEPILRDYFWIRNSYHGIHRLTEEEIKTEVRKKMGKGRPRSKRQKEPTSLSKDLLAIGKDMVLMQDVRKKYMMKAAYYLHELLKQEGKRYGLTPLLMTQSLPEEVLSLNSRNACELKKKLESRLRSCTVIGDLSKGIQVFDGQIVFPKGVQRRAKFEIRGRVACGGKAAGRARVLARAEDIYKVNHGDIIVAPMTSPDFMPAIRRCVAIVTDFGGITCHAAIISREFNLPCIVGTENATEVLHDGDLVEVDADTGIIKVLQEAS